MSDFTGLSISGRIATPSDPDWDEARVAWNLIADQRPEAVAMVESADDVARVVSFAAESGLRVAGQGTGHGAAPLQPLDGTILIKTERMRGIEVDPTARTALWSPRMARLARWTGRTTPICSGPSWRRWWLRDRHRTATRAAPDRRSLRRRPGLPGDGRRRGGAHLPRLGGEPVG